MISEKLQKEINDQIQREIWSAQLYISMAFYFEREGFDGFANWMKKQSDEEKEHAYTMASYLIKRGGTPRFEAIAAVPNEWKCPLDVFEKVYAHECSVSKNIDNLLDIDRIRKMGDTAIFGLDQQYGQRSK